MFNEKLHYKTLNVAMEGGGGYMNEDINFVEMFRISDPDLTIQINFQIKFWLQNRTSCRNYLADRLVAYRVSATRMVLQPKFD